MEFHVQYVNAVPFVAHCFHGLPWWPDKDKSCIGAFLGKGRILAQLEAFQPIYSKVTLYGIHTNPYPG